MTELQVAQIIHDLDCPGCPAQPIPHPVSECLYGISREKHLKAAHTIVEQWDESTREVKRANRIEAWSEGLSELADALELTPSVKGGAA